MKEARDMVGATKLEGEGIMSLFTQQATIYRDKDTITIGKLKTLLMSWEYRMMK